MAMVEEEDKVSVAVDVVDTMDNRLIGWKMEATIMKLLPKVAMARDIVEGAVGLHLIGHFRQQRKAVTILNVTKIMLVMLDATLVTCLIFYSLLIQILIIHFIV